MSDVIEFGPGGYRFLKGVFQYSAGVGAMPGYAIERARFREPVPLARGFSLIGDHFEKIGQTPIASIPASLICSTRAGNAARSSAVKAFRVKWVPVRVTKTRQNKRLELRL